jgi:PRTRC genetic system protein E
LIACIELNTHHPTEKKMFTELMPLLRKRRFLLSISPADGERIRVTLIPQKTTETEDNAITTPLAITGTAEELDRELPAQLAEFVATHIQLQSTLATAKAEMEAAAKAAREEVRKKAKPATSAPPSNTAKPMEEPAASEPPSLFSTQQQTETNTEAEAVTAAGGTTP